MLLGCCHCDEAQSSSSDVPSSSMSSSSYNTTGCFACAVAPMRYLATVVHQVGTNSSLCCSDYNNSFVLTNTGGCLWESDELAKYVYTAPGPANNSCAITTGTDIAKRFSLVISGALSYNVYQIHYTSDGIGGAITYRHRYTKTFASSDCFANRRIPWFSEASLGAAFNINGLAGTESTLPCGYNVTMSNFYVDLVAL